jgi:hypothetical protein
MNASMAWRIRFAELHLIYAIDRQLGEQRERSQAAQSKPTRSDSRLSTGMGTGRVETRNRTRSSPSDVAGPECGS